MYAVLNPYYWSYSWQILTTVQFAGCGGHFTADEATIMSPNFPDPYAIDDDCEWLIEVASSYLVMIEFYDFEIPQALNCTIGHVAVSINSTHEIYSTTAETKRRLT